MDSNNFTMPQEGSPLEVIDTTARWFTVGLFGLHANVLSQYDETQKIAYLIGGIFGCARDTGAEIPEPLAAHLLEVQESYRASQNHRYVREESAGRADEFAARRSGDPF